MSYGGTAEDGSGIENPLAVYVRNVPVWFLEESRFLTLIRDWKGVDKQKSGCFQNKVNSSWNGWAIVYFKSTRERDEFLDKDDLHYVRTPSGLSDKLKVSPWVQKTQQHTASRPPAATKPALPLYKTDIAGFTPEEFDRNCTDSSIHSFRGRIHSYLTDADGRGHNGFIEIRLQQPGGKDKTERILFHSDSFWSCFGCHKKACFGDTDCVQRGGTDNQLPRRLPVGSDVIFKARKIPAGLAGAYRYQAKSVWQGDDTQPKYVTPPSSQRLDEYLEDYLQESSSSAASGGGLPGARSRDYQSPPSFSLESASQPQDAKTADGQTPVFSGSDKVEYSQQEVKVSSRQKPLAGGLKQLSSSLEQSIAKQPVKKAPPSNFAQAVAASSTTATEDYATADILLEKGTIDSFPNPTEVIVSVPQYGKFTLNLGHFESIRSWDLIAESRQDASLLVALSKVRQLPGGNTTFVPVKAFVEKLKKRPPPSLSTASPALGSRQQLVENAPDTWEDLADRLQQPTNHVAASISSHSKGENDINLEDLDAYYDSCYFDFMSDYFAEVLPRLLPKARLDKTQFDQLANEISLLEDDSMVAAVLRNFLQSYPEIEATRRDSFIRDLLVYKKSTAASPSSVVGGDDNSLYDILPLTTKEQEKVGKFLTWTSNNIKMEALQVMYSDLLKFNPELARTWLNFDDGSGNGNGLFDDLDEQLIQKLETWFREAKTCTMELAEFQATLEADTYRYRAELSKKVGKSLNDLPCDDEKRFSTFNGLILSPLEHEFVQHQEKAPQTSIFIVRILIFLRKGNISWEELMRLHGQFGQGPARRKLFNTSLTELLFSACNQHMLDETNAAVHNNRHIKTREHTPISHKRLDRFVPVACASICSFLAACADQQLWPPAQQPGGVTRKLSSSSTGRDAPSLVNGGQVSKEASSQNGIGSTGSGFCREQFEDFAQFLRQNSSANEEKILKAFQDRNVAWSTLQKLRTSCMAAGGCLAWNLEISKLQLNPPVPVSVAQIGQLLWHYFDRTAGAGGMTREIKTEKSLLIEDFIVPNLLEQHQLLASKHHQPGSDLFDNLRTGSATICQFLFTSSKPERLPENYPDLLASLCCKIWSYHKLTASFFEQAIRDLYKTAKFGLNIINPMEVMLRNWAEILESSLSPFSDSCVIDVFTIIRITLAGFDKNVRLDIQRNGIQAESIHQRIFSDLLTSTSLYNTVGIVVERLGASCLIIQTRCCKVVAHLSSFFTHCNLKEPPSHPCHHWARLERDASPPLGLKVRLHSRQIRHGKDGAAVAHVALLVWAPMVDTSHVCWGPPETGVLAPVYRLFLEKTGEIVGEHGDSSEEDQGGQFLAYWLESMTNKMDEDAIGSWTRDLGRMRQIWVLQRLGLLTAEAYNSHLAGTLEPYIPTSEICYQLEYEEAVEAFLDEDRMAVKMVSYFQRCESKEGLVSAVEQLCSKYQIPDSLIDVDYYDEEEDEEEDGKEREEEREVTDFHHKDMEKNSQEADPVKAGTEEGRASSSDEAATEQFRDAVLQRLDSLDKAVNIINEWLTGALEVVDKRIGAVEEAMGKLSIVGDTASREGGGRCYVRMARDGDLGEVSELPTNEQGLLHVSTVKALFEGTTALKYWVEVGKKGLWRVVVLEDDLFHPPPEGWGQALYICCIPAGLSAGRSTGGLFPVGSGLSPASNTTSSPLIMHSVWPPHHSSSSSFAADFSNSGYFSHTNGQK